MKYFITTDSEVKCYDTFTDLIAAIKEAKRLSKELCCDCYVRNSDGVIVVFINKRFVDSLGRYHEINVIADRSVEEYENIE